jgi:hypothetical protein
VGNRAAWLASLAGAAGPPGDDAIASLDTDSTFTANSDLVAPSQKAVKTALAGETSTRAAAIAAINTALALKAPLASAALTGTPTAPTAADATNTAFVHSLVTNLIGSAPGALDTLGELATQLASDESAVAALTATVTGKLAKVSNLSDLTDFAAARSNLGLVIGTNVQAQSATLNTWAGIAPGSNVGNALAIAIGSAGAVLLNNGSAANLTGFPTLNQNTTGNAATANSVTLNGVSGLGTNVSTALGLTANTPGGILTHGSGALLAAANTFTAAQTVRVAGLGSTPSNLVSGSIFTGGTTLTTLPKSLIQPVIHTHTGVTGSAATDIITATGHAFVPGNAVGFTAITGGAGLAISTIYYVINVSGNTFQLSLTSGGAAINFTTDITAATITNYGVWNAFGTALGINTASGFTGDLINAQTNGVVAFAVNANGQASFTDLGSNRTWIFSGGNLSPLGDNQASLGASGTRIASGWFTSIDLTGGTVTVFQSTTSAISVGQYLCGQGAASVGIPVRVSPTLNFAGQAWNTTATAATKQNAVDLYLLPVSGATTSGRFICKNATVDGNANLTELFSVTTGGAFAIPGSLAVTGASTLGTLTCSPAASATPAINGQLTFEATSNTSLTVKFKGSDGTVRTNVLTLA